MTLPERLMIIFLLTWPAVNTDGIGFIVCKMGGILKILENIFTFYLLQSGTFETHLTFSQDM